MQGASTVCVLIGSETYERPWVRYEIARAIIDERGLVGVHINGLKLASAAHLIYSGTEPIDYMGLWHAFGRVLICERHSEQSIHREVGTILAALCRMV